MITHTNKTNAGNKRSFSVAKIYNAISTRHKKQRDQGRYEAMKYFMKGGETKALTWLELIFDDAKGGGGGERVRRLGNEFVLWDGAF